MRPLRRDRNSPTAALLASGGRGHQTRRRWTRVSQETLHDFDEASYVAAFFALKPVREHLGRATTRAGASGTFCTTTNSTTVGEAKAFAFNAFAIILYRNSPGLARSLWSLRGAAAVEARQLGSTWYLRGAHFLSHSLAAQRIRSRWTRYPLQLTETGCDVLAGTSPGARGPKLATTTWTPPQTLRPSHRHESFTGTTTSQSRFSVKRT